jgi:hypothetical protein
VLRLLAPNAAVPEGADASRVVRATADARLRVVYAPAGAPASETSATVRAAEAAR